MGRLTSGLVGAVAGYAVGALAGAALVALASGNTHDRYAEIVVTALLVVGPIGAVLGLMAGLIRGGRNRRAGGA